MKQGRLSCQKEGQGGRQGGCETGEEKVFPSYCPTRQAGTAGGQEFHFNHPPWSSYWFSQCAVFSAEFSSMDPTVRNTHRMHTYFTYKHTQLIKEQRLLIVQLLHFMPSWVQTNHSKLVLTFKLKQFMSFLIKFELTWKSLLHGASALKQPVDSSLLDLLESHKVATTVLYDLNLWSMLQSNLWFNCMDFSLDSRRIHLQWHLELQWSVNESTG